MITLTLSLKKLLEVLFGQISHTLLKELVTSKQEVIYNGEVIMISLSLQLAIFLQVLVNKEL